MVGGIGGAGLLASPFYVGTLSTKPVPVPRFFVFEF